MSNPKQLSRVISKLKEEKIIDEEEGRLRIHEG